MLNLRKYLYKKMFDSQNRIIVKKKKLFLPKAIVENYKTLQYYSFGEKNKNKIFYVIQRKEGGGFFSNVLYVLNHLIVADKYNFIPVIDMENFEGFYNEESKINGTLNSWEYYFYQPSNYSLKEVYKSKNVIITSNKTFKNYKYRAFNRYKDLKKVFIKYIKIKKNIINEADKIIKKININKKNMIGLHWRGTDHKFLPNHPQPPSRSQIYAKIKKAKNRKKFDKIFVVTEDLCNLKILLKKYKSKILYLNSFRSTKSSDFSNFKRKNHRYKVGKDSLIEVLVLSHLDYLICSESNISDFAKFISSNNKYAIDRIFNYRNSKNSVKSYLNWKLKSVLPSSLGGY